MTSTLDMLFAVRRLNDARLEPTAMLVLYALVAHRDQKGHITASLGQLAGATRLARSTLHTALDRLTSAGLLRVHRCRRGDRNLPNAYELVLPDHAALASTLEPDDALGGEGGPAAGLPLLELVSSGSPVAGPPPSGERTTPVRLPEGGSPAAGPSEDLSADLSADSPAESAPRRRPLRPLHIRRLEQAAVVEAFESGVREATGNAYAVPRGELRDLDDALDTHGPELAHTGQRDEWLRETAATYRRSTSGRERFYSHGGPRGFLHWLNSGRPCEVALAPLARQRRALEQRMPAEGHGFKIRELEVG